MLVGQAVIGGLLLVRQAVGVHLRNEREPLGQGEVPDLQRHLASLGDPDGKRSGRGRLGDEDLRQPMACPAMAVGPFGKRGLSRRVAGHQCVAVGLDGEQPCREPVRQRAVRVLTPASARRSSHTVSPRAACSTASGRPNRSPTAIDRAGGFSSACVAIEGRSIFFGLAPCAASPACGAGAADAAGGPSVTQTSNRGATAAFWSLE